MSESPQRDGNETGAIAPAIGARRVLLTGAGGFIGRSVAAALRRAGHVVVETAHGRDADGPGRIGVDFSRDTDAADWLPRLAGVDAVVNAVGLLVERGAQTFDAVHLRAPRALFEACATLGVRRVVQVSALGADVDAAAAFQRSKKLADDALLALPLSACVVQPSLVFGLDGASARWLLALAASPWLALPGRGDQRIQPIHVEDVAEAIVRLVEAPAVPPRMALVGPRALTLRAYLLTLRTSMGLPPARVFVVPLRAVRLFSSVAGAAGSGLTPDALAMLERGNHADASPLTALLGRSPRPPAAFVAPHEAAAARRLAALTPFVPLLRAGVSAVWLGAAFVSAFVYPRAASLALLAALGLSGTAAVAALYAGVVVDAALGLAVWRRRWRAVAYRLQIATMLAYTLALTVALPAFWAHPFGPLVKNLPLLVLTALLLRIDRR